MQLFNNTPFHAETLPFKGPKNKTILTVIVKGTYEFAPGKPLTVASEQISVAFGDEFHNNEDGGSLRFESDMAPFKPRADIALVGRAYAPKGKAVQILDVLLRVGHIKKILRVIGNRRWVYSSSLLPEYPSKPRLFSTMDIVYERAFGGIDRETGIFCKENLIGRGFFAKKSKKILDGAPLPNIEDPGRLIKSWKDHPKPVGFGFCSRTWIPRAACIGTYDEKWRKEHSPDPPEDFRFDYYNAAHPDLQVEGYLRGDEEVELVNLTPDGTVRFQLPGNIMDCIVTKSPRIEDELSSQSPVTEKVNLNLDTLCLIPDEKRLYLVWRGICPVNDLTAAEVESITVT